MGVVVITGCSSGFGYHAALAFGRRGDRVYATMRNPQKGDLAKVISDEGLDAEVVQLDVDDDANVRAGIGEVLDREGRVDVLVNNAGFGGTGNTIEECTDEAWHQIFSTNLFGPLRCSRAVLPSMREQGSGTIVNVSSIAGRMYGMPFTASYSASKHALCSLSDSIAAELKDFGVKVACIEPGFFKTEVMNNATVPDPTGSPYESMARAIETWYRTSVENGADPKAVVDALLAAADGTLPTDTIHHLVGDDAQLFVGGMEQMSYADYQAMGREMLGI
jgi:NAD(P)-dependent dehydrogenase (short-subunit alcohol dehydrogenase family)